MSAAYPSRYPSAFVQAFLLCLFYFALFFLFNEPVISAFEDLHVEYLLSGGYGQPASVRLHYQYGWHPFLFSPVYALYHWLPKTNWYGIFLILLQFLAHLLLIKQIVVQLGIKKAFVFYLLFFLLFGFPFLQKLEIATSSSLLALTASTSLLLIYKRRPEINTWLFRKEELLPVFTLLLAFLLRIHTGLLLLTVFIPIAYLAGGLRYFKRFVLMTLLAIVASLALFLMQGKFYEQDPQYISWKSKSDLYYSMINRPNTNFVAVDSIQKMESSFILNQYLIDSSLITAPKIQPYVRAISFPIVLSADKNNKTLYWAFKNNRLTLLLIAVLLIGSFLVGGNKVLFKSILVVSIGFATYLGLVLFLKIREHVTLSLSAFIFLSVTLITIHEWKGMRKSYSYLLLGLLIPLAFWRVIQQSKSRSALSAQIISTRSFIAASNKNSETLYINLTNEGWMALGAFDSPNQFQLKNVLTRDLLMTGKFLSLFKKFHVEDLTNQLVDHPNIVLLGARQPDWVRYYLWRKGKSVEIITHPGLKPVPGFQLKSKY
jgi:hypothetical protein